nr:hypothetical protein [Tanacetum cinerariifolium]
MVQGVLTDGTWCANLQKVKGHVFQFFHDKFQAQDSQIDFNTLSAFHRLNESDCSDLEHIAFLDEIKQDVWGCGSSKSPGPLMLSPGTNSAFITLIPKVFNPLLVKDYRPISLIGMHYKIVVKLLANRLTKVVDKIVSQQQSAFISGRPILDGPLMLGEVINWYKKRSKKILIFKVNFEKAFDSVGWNYLDFILGRLGFGGTWHLWIRECRCSARTSILVNGSPTAEFSFKRGLRQGFKINIQKSNFFGIGVTDSDLSSMVRLTRCSEGPFPFTYLGLPIGSNMNLISSWSTIIDRFKSKLSSWKANRLSIGERGGLGIESLKYFNFALLLKWLWRLVSNPNALWVSINKAIHEEDVGLGTSGCIMNGVWAAIIGSINTIHSNDILPKETLGIKLVTEPKLSFGKTPGSMKNPSIFATIVSSCWTCMNIAIFMIDGPQMVGYEIGVSRLKRVVLMLYSHPCLPNCRMSLTDNLDSWFWQSGKDGVYTIGDIHRYIDDHILPSIGVTTI